jgi:hypothetical protein
MHEWAQTKRPMESVAREAKPAAVAQAK